MRRRDFLTTAAAASITPSLVSGVYAAPSNEHPCCGATYASPKEAMKAEPETLAFVPAIYAGTKVKKPDYLATVDVDPESKSYGQVVSRLEMPSVGDELHHYGWNACSSCHGDPDHSRRFLIVPGLVSSRIHVIDMLDPRKPKLHKVINGEEVKRKTKLSAPHTVHCLADGQIMISMLGDAGGDAPGGFMLLDDEFNVVGRWGKKSDAVKYSYDYWYQPRHNIMVSSEWGAPNTVRKGFSLDDVKAGKYGQRLHFWDWQKQTVQQTIDLGETGLIPLEVRFHHNPDSTHGFVGAALSSAIWHWSKEKDNWQAENIVQVESKEVEGWPFPVPGLITDLVLSLDDRFLYFANWLHGDIRQYDVSDPSQPRMKGQVWLGGNLGEPRKVRGNKLHGGPQMLQLSLDGRRLYVTNSLYSVWDNQFYPDIGNKGSYMLQLDCNTKSGGLSLNEDFYVDFGSEPHGPARAHEIRFPGGDCTSDIWV